MNVFFRLEPEVPGQKGPKTKMDVSVHPPKVTHLNFIFDGWLGDELIECFPCFLASERLINCFQAGNIHGYRALEAEIEYSEQFKEIVNVPVPPFKWIILKENNNADIFILENYLTVNEKAFKIIKECGNINNCSVQPFNL